MTCLGIKNIKNPRNLMIKHKLHGGHFNATLTYDPSEIEEEYCDGCDYKLDDLIKLLHEDPIEALKLGQRHRLILYKKYCDTCDQICIVNLGRASYRCGKNIKGKRCHFAYGIFRSTVFEYLQAPIENIFYLIHCYVSAEFSYEDINSVLRYPPHAFNNWRKKCDTVVAHYCKKKNLDNGQDKEMKRVIFLESTPKDRAFHNFLYLMNEVWDPYLNQRLYGILGKQKIPIMPVAPKVERHLHFISPNEYCFKKNSQLSNDLVGFYDMEFCNGCYYETLELFFKEISTREKLTNFLLKHRFIVPNKMCSNCNELAPICPSIFENYVCPNANLRINCSRMKLLAGTFFNSTLRGAQKLLEFMYLKVHSFPIEQLRDLYRFQLSKMGCLSKFVSKTYTYACKVNKIPITSKRNYTEKEFKKLVPEKERFHTFLMYASESECNFQEEYNLRIKHLNISEVGLEVSENIKPKSPPIIDSSSNNDTDLNINQNKEIASPIDLGQSKMKRRRTAEEIYFAKKEQSKVRKLTENNDSDCSFGNENSEDPDDVSEDEVSPDNTKLDNSGSPVNVQLKQEPIVYTPITAHSRVAVVNDVIILDISDSEDED